MSLKRTTHPVPGPLVQAHFALGPVWGRGEKGRVVAYCPGG